MPILSVIILYPITDKVIGLNTVFSSTKDQNNVVHIILNMPIPFADRDYVVKYDS